MAAATRILRLFRRTDSPLPELDRPVPLVTVQDLIDAGVHFGHQASRWNPKMRPYIHGKRHRIHIIDLQATIRGLYKACHFLRHIAATGAQVLLLGTKRQIRAVVLAEATRSGMPAVTERWIGGTLTNFNTVRERLKRLEELQSMEAAGSMEKFKKKDQASLRREMRKIGRNLEGIRDLHGLPGAIVVVDPRREENCIREAARMNVPVIAVLDTDCDPDLADIVIPANDDAMSSVQLILSRLVDAILEGRAGADESTLMQAEKFAKEDVRAKAVQGRRASPSPGPRRSGPGRPPGGGGGGRRRGRFAEAPADHVSIGGVEGAVEEEESEASAEPPAAPSPE
jgi:small subunit ribosomal protein S2